LKSDALTLVDASAYSGDAVSRYALMRVFYRSAC